MHCVTQTYGQAQQVGRDRRTAKKSLPPGGYAPRRFAVDTARHCHHCAYIGHGFNQVQAAIIRYAALTGRQAATPPQAVL